MIDYPLIFLLLNAQKIFINRIIDAILLLNPKDKSFVNFASVRSYIITF